jgi:hypothetical protein
VNASEAAGNKKGFRVYSSNGVLHILPKTGALLDSSITLAVKQGSLGELVARVIQLVNQRTGKKVLVGVAPGNMFRMAQLTAFDATNERAGDVLVRAMQTAAPSSKLSWQLLFDYTRDTYYLSIQIVE